MDKQIDISKNKFIFNNKNVLMILDDENNPWFKAKDIAEILEYKDTKQTIRKNIDEDDKIDYKSLTDRSVSETPQNNIQNHTIFINESGLYSLILSSKKEEAKLFKKWITKEVLPNIRKFGEYKLKSEIEHLENQIEQMKNDVVCKKFNSEKHHEFVLIKKNHLWEYPYYVIRTQKREINSRIKELKHVYPELEILLRFNDPNSINLYNQMKESLNITCHGNHFKTQLCDSELIFKISKINLDKISYEH